MGVRPRPTRSSTRYCSSTNTDAASALSPAGGSTHGGRQDMWCTEARVVFAFHAQSIGVDRTSRPTAINWFTRERAVPSFSTISRRCRRVSTASPTTRTPCLRIAIRCTT